MAINGINSYGMGYYNYQSSINNIRLTQALSRNPRLSQVTSSPKVSMNSSLKSSMDFVKKYTSSMSDLMSAANNLKSYNKSGVMNDFKVTSSDESVATASKKFSVNSGTKTTLKVSQIATAQKNTSKSVTATDTAKKDMKFTLGQGLAKIDVNVRATKEDGTDKTNIEVLKEAAGQINEKSDKVTAKVVEKDGMASLELTGKETGADNSFTISGELGAAEGLDVAAVEAGNAKYSVTSGNNTFNAESSTNEISVDYTRINVTLKGTGETTIGAAVDTDKAATGVQNLVDAYNSSLKLLNDNYDRGTGVQKQLRNLVAGLGDEKSLEKLGITVNKDATLKFDKSVFAKSMKEDPKFTTNLIGGLNGIADRAFSKASTGMNTSSSSLINGDLANAENDAMSNPFNMYSKAGVFAMNNFGAVGMMLNYLV